MNVFFGSVQPRLLSPRRSRAAVMTDGDRRPAPPRARPIATRSAGRCRLTALDGYERLREAVRLQRFLGDPVIDATAVVPGGTNTAFRVAKTGQAPVRGHL